MNNSVIIPTNRYQTPIDDKLKASLHPEVFSELVDFITSVEFIQNLISPDRPLVQDLPKDERGRAIIDVTRPHILKDMEYFIQERIHYLKFGYYTAAKFSRNPNSDYRRYWDEQEKRSIEGYVNEETGEWVPGYLYWYWNFGLIMLTKERKGSKISKSGAVRSDRIEMFPDIWEIDYFYFHYIEQAEENGRYASLLKCRGMGASFKSAAMAVRNFFLIRKSKSYMFSYHDNYLYEDGIMTKVMDMENFVQLNTAFKKRKLKSSIKHLKAGFKDKASNNSENGYLSEIIPVNTKDPNSARGKRGKLVIHEESGSHRHLMDSWRITDKSLDDKGNVFGLQIAQGTGGDEQSDFKGLSLLFFRPRPNKVYAIRNVFDKNASNTFSGFFMGEYMNRPRSYNKDGVTDVIKNLILIFNTRFELQKELDDPEELAKKKAESAITPLESITTMTHSVFPVDAEKEQIAQLLSNWEQVTNNHYTCRPIMKDGKVKLINSREYFPITEFPYTGNRPHKAAVTIKTMPEKHADDSIPSYRYIIGVDTLDDDEGQGSYFSWQLMDLWKDDIVAWYIGRNVMVEDDYEIVRLMAIMYNATINYENNFKGLYAHFKNTNSLRLLADTPQILLDKAYIGKTYSIGNKSKGTRANARINEWGRRLQAEWQRKPHMYYKDKTGVETIEDIEYLRECSMWDNLGNFDKVSSGIMLFIYREELIKMTESTRFEKESKSDYEDDEFLNEFYVPLIPENSYTVSDNDLNF